MLKDFPQDGADVEALLRAGMEKLQGVFLVEELFSRELDDEDDEEEAKRAEEAHAAARVGSPEQEGAEEVPKPKEQLFNLLADRAKVFEDVIKINRILKNQALGSELRQCVVKRLKFEGPANPMDLPTPPEDGSEPPPVDEELKAAQFKMYEAFADRFKKQVEDLAESLQDFRGERARAVSNMVQLWPVPVDPAAEEERQKLQELRESQEREKAREEEERRAAEAAQKGGKKSAQKAPVGGAKDDQEEDAQEGEEQEVAEVAEPFKSQDDDPSKTWDFFQFKKIMSEIPPGTTTVGSMLGAMVYQISQDNAKRVEGALDEKHYEGKVPTKKLSMGLRKKSTMALQQAEADEEAMAGFFDDALQSLMLEHSLVETDYKHTFKEP